MTTATYSGPVEVTFIPSAFPAEIAFAATTADSVLCRVVNGRLIRVGVDLCSPGPTKRRPRGIAKAK